ncbi:MULTISPECIES: hypothetical protein [unclassified Pseudomonas]|uniref:DUF6916 family protein n=1 Tax=unclassified Pseudomonas TaxID=196821 RepID=UPI000CCFE86E|nr:MULTISPECIES: hypothetical protein [unclassified Pseudomonas]POA27289.1 hypothetical protein C1887_27315 [Pseudomonas sp. GW456-R21]POA64578.1 hypothetical protein C1884_20555 [Pseudomonas sp. GW460-R15]
MQQQVNSDHFRQLLETPTLLYLEDGSQLSVIIELVEDVPRARLSESSRMPFGVTLSSPDLTSFVDGLCAIDLPELGRIEGIFVSRTLALGRDASRAYFYITFN